MPDFALVPRTSSVLNTYEPPIEMRRFVNVLLSEEVKGNKSEAERRTGVKRENFYYHFRTSAEFRTWFSTQCDLFLGKNEAMPAYSLLSQIVQGDVQAIRTYYEMRGKIRSQFASTPVGVGVNVLVERPCAACHHEAPAPSVSRIVVTRAETDEKALDVVS